MFKFNPVTFHSHYRKNEPICPIAEGQSVQTTTLDAHGGSPEGRRSTGFSNPLTGPFVIAAAQSGDSLVITLHSIHPLGKQGWSYAYPRPWLMDTADAQTFPQKVGVPWTMDAENGLASTTVVAHEKLTVAMHPMLGCVGLACDPALKATSQDAGPFGGNLDFPLLGAGVQLQLPVFIPGGYLYLGDAHAVQLGGEITGAAIEIPAEVEFSAILKKRESIQWPRGETAELLFTTGTDKPFELAVQHALSEMIRLIEGRFGLSHADAAAVVGQLGDLQVCNLVSTTYTAACVISKTSLSALM